MCDPKRMADGSPGTWQGARAVATYYPRKQHWLTYSQTELKFLHDKVYVPITFDMHGVDIGCTRVSSEAMTKLVELWSDYIKNMNSKIIQ